MYTLRRLGSPGELSDFKAGYEQTLAERSSHALTLSLPLDYLSASEVMGVIGPHGSIVGGFVMRYTPPFRCLRAVPDEVRRRSPLLQSVPETALCELTCIWRHRELSSFRFATRVWPRIIAMCVRSRRRYILGLGFENRMYDTYQVWSPHVIYHGPSAAAETATVVHIFAFGRARIVANFVTNFVLQVPGKLLRAGRPERR